MASTLSDFDKEFRSLKYRVEVDLLTPNVFVDYSDQVEFVNIYEKIENGLTGNVSQDCDIRLIIPNFDTRWQRTGLNVKVYVSISSDNWVSSYEYLWYEGVTENKTTVSDKEVNLKAVSRLSTVLNAKTSGAFGNFTQTFRQILELLLNQGGISYDTAIYPSNITSFTMPFIGLVQNLFIGLIIDEICRACNYYYRYSQGVVVFNRINYTNRLALDGYKRQFNLNQILKYTDIKSSDTFYNVVTVEGRTVRYIEETDPNNPLYCNLQLNSQEVKAGEKLYVLLDDKDLVDYFFVNPLVGTNPSYFKAYTTDDFTLPFSNAGVTASSFGKVIRDNKTKFLAVFSNSNGSSRWIKEICIRGSGAVQTDQISYTGTGTELINDRQNKELEVYSDYIYSTPLATTICNEILDNFNSTKRYFEIIIKGNPDNKVGDIIRIQDRLSNYMTVVIMEIDSEISRDRGFEQTLLVKEV